jgi:hypothetical protein
VHPTPFFGFQTLRVIVTDAGARPERAGELQYGALAFDGATLISRLRPDPPPDLTADMGSPDFVVCACGVVVKARVRTAMPRKHRCPHGETCAWRPLCDQCLVSFDARESGPEAENALIYVITFAAKEREWHLVVVTGQPTDAVDRSVPGWQRQIERHNGKLLQRVQLDRWRCGATPLNG